MSLYASNMTCYCVNLSYDEFINKINEDKDRYTERLRDYAGNYLYFENPKDLKDYEGKIHHDLVIVNDRGELTRIGANLYIDKDNNNKSGFLEYDSRTHEVKIDRTKIKEIKGDLVIGVNNAILVKGNNTTITGGEINVRTKSGNIIHTLFKGTGSTVHVGVSPDKVYLGDVLLKDLLDKDDILDKRTQSLITDINSWPDAVMNLYPIKSSLVSNVISYKANNVDGKFIFSGTNNISNTLTTGEIEIFNIESVYHLFSDILGSSTILYIYANTSLNSENEKQINFYISSKYFNFIYIDEKYRAQANYLEDATDVKSLISKYDNTYWKYTVKCPGEDDSSITGTILKLIYSECNKDTVDKDKVRLVNDIITDYSETAPYKDTWHNMNVNFKFRHVGYIKVCSEITGSVVPAINEYRLKDKTIQHQVSFYTQTNNSASPKVGKSSLYAGFRTSMAFNKYFAGTKNDTNIYNISYDDYYDVSDETIFNKCNDTQNLLGRINQVFAEYGEVVGYNKAKNYYYSSQKDLYTRIANPTYKKTNAIFYRKDDNNQWVEVPANTIISADSVSTLFLKDSLTGVYIKVEPENLEDVYVLSSPKVTAWNYDEKYNVQLTFSALKDSSSVTTWYKNIIKKPIPGIVELKESQKSNNNSISASDILSKFEFTQAALNEVVTVPIDYTKIFRYKLNNSTEWSNWMSFNNSEIRFNEDDELLTIQVPSVGWTGNLGASGIFMLSDLYRQLGGKNALNSTILPSQFGDINLTVDVETGSTYENSSIFSWIQNSFNDAKQVFSLPKNSSENIKNFSMVEAISVANYTYPGLLLSNTLFMNIRSCLSETHWNNDDSQNNIETDLTNFFTFKNAQPGVENDASKNHYLITYKIPLKDYPTIDVPTRLNFKYVAIPTHGDYKLKIFKDANLIFKDPIDFTQTDKEYNKQENI